MIDSSIFTYNLLYSVDKVIMRRFAYIFIIITFSVNLFAEIFQFNYSVGDKYQILSITYEDVYINDTYLRSVNILNKTSFEVTEEDNNIYDFNADFYVITSDISEIGIFELDDIENVYYQKEKNGRLHIDPLEIYPILRNLPVFPDDSVNQGDSWTFPASEVHRLSDVFGINRVELPLNVTYKYSGDTIYNGRQVKIIDIEYQIFTRFDYFESGNIHKISGESTRSLYWDYENGTPVASFENFDIYFTLYDGNEIRYTGTTDSAWDEVEDLNQNKIITDIEDRLIDSEIQYRIESDGITLILDNLYFQPDSDHFLPGETEKLQLVAEILEEQASGRDILITGHTARVLDEQSCIELSNRRAEKVASLLNELVDNNSLFFWRGVGSTQPVASNETEAGRAQNRRVEIKILEN